MLANAVYSSSNAIPLNALRASIADCGRLAMSFDAIRFGRAWWFCGKSVHSLKIHACWFYTWSPSLQLPPLAYNPIFRELVG